MAVEVRFVAGDWGSWMVTFRRTRETIEHPEEFYLISFSPRGEYVIEVTVWPTSSTLASGHTPAFKSGLETNYLQIIAKGPEMAFYLNGEPLQLVSDETVSGGTIIFSMSSDTATPLEVRFDNLKVWDITGLAP